MNPELQKALLDIIEQSKTVAAREIPLVLKDLLTAGTIESVIGIFFSFLLLGIAWGLFKAYLYWQAKDEERHNYTDYELQRFFGGIGIIISVFLSGLTFSISVYNLLIIWLAPRAYLIELVKNK